jgi:hypothetical protein
VSSALSIPACQPDRRTLTAHSDAAGASCGYHKVEALDAGGEADSGAGVPLVGPFLERDVFEAVHPDGQRAGACRTAQVVVAGVAHDEAQVVRVCKANGGHDVAGRAHVNCVGNVVAQRTGAGAGREWVAALICE